MLTKNSRRDTIMDKLIFWAAMLGVVVALTVEWMQ
jgi:hypothetical protein